MNELDFDELDKAVSSLMEKRTKDPSESISEEEKPTVELHETPVTKQPEAKSTEDDDMEEDVKPLDLSSADDHEKEDVLADEKEADKEDIEPVSEKPTITAVKSTKRSGRFMDVVHPSSDMRPKLMKKPQGGNVITPLNDTVKPESPADSVLAETDKEETSSLATEHAWPDPIDMMKPDTESDMPEKKEEPKVSLPEPKSEPEQEPQASPFLPGAKVEKRPLGTQAPTGVVNELDEQETEKTDVSTDIPLQSEEKSPLPVELDGDIVAIEADNPHMGAGNHEEPRVSEVVAKSGLTPSIVQQYKEKPSSSDDQHAALYDSTPEKPLKHPAKKKSGWMTVVWIVLLVVIVGAAVAALYYFKII